MYWATLRNVHTLSAFTADKIQHTFKTVSIQIIIAYVPQK